MRGPNGEELPSSVLFACTHNAIRSPIAAALMKFLYGQYVYIESVGVHAGEVDGFAIAVMEEMGIDISGHEPRAFEELTDTSFDMVISFSPEAQHKAVELARTMAIEIEYWPTIDPTLVEGSREVRLEAYRELRDELLKRLRDRFSPPMPGHVG